MKLSPHCLFGSSDARRIVTQGFAPVIKLVDDFAWASDFASLPHHPLLIGRKTAPRELLDYNPAQRFHDGADSRGEAHRFLHDLRDGGGWSMADNIRANPHVDAWEGPNEPVFSTPEEMNWYARFETERARLLFNLGTGAVVGNFSVGTPDLGLWTSFYPAIDAIRLYSGFLGLHEYWDWTPDMNPPWYPGNLTWHQLRYRRVAEIFGANMPSTVITECGWDTVPLQDSPHPKTGYSPGKPFHLRGLGIGEYFNSLKAYDQELQKDSYIVGATIFTFGNGWPDHNVEGDGLADLLITYWQEAPAEEIDMTLLESLVIVKTLRSLTKRSIAGAELTTVPANTHLMVYQAPVNFAWAFGDNRLILAGTTGKSIWADPDPNNPSVQYL